MWTLIFKPKRKEALMTTDQIKNIEVFFNKNIDPEAFALQMRCFMNAAVTYYMNNDDMLYQAEIRNGYHFLNEFVEVLDPVLEKCQK